jgi:hypothetical protein
MIIYPAIDLRGGRCVRLVQGDPQAETIVSHDPVGTAQRWESLGAEKTPRRWPPSWKRWTCLSNLEEGCGR